MRIVFLGSSEFGIPALDAMRKAGHEVAGVVTLPPAPRGRGKVLTPTPVAEYAQDAGLSPVLTPASLKDAGFAEELRKLQADVFVVIAFRILPQGVFSIPRLGTLNVHASLLPRFRGSAPIQRAIEAGETETGVTIFRIDAGIDTGAVLAQRSTRIGPEETTPQLSERLSALGAELLLPTLDALGRGTATPLPQDSSLASPAPKLSKEDGRIDWRQPASLIFNRLRAYKPFPGSYTTIAGELLSVEWAQPVDGTGAPGAILAAGREGIDVACGEGALRVLHVKPQGKRVMGAADFVNGHHLQRGMVFA